MQGKIVFLMWVSGSGKGTLTTFLRQDERFIYIPSYTSRPIRETEINGDKYRYISRAEFEESIHADEFLEYALVHQNHYYGTKKKPLYDAIAQGKHALKEVEVNGLEKLHAEGKITSDVVTIFLTIDDQTMQQRILGRQPDISPDELAKRMASAPYERNVAQKLCNRIIDASQPVEVVLQNVKHAIENFVTEGELN